MDRGSEIACRWAKRLSERWINERLHADPDANTNLPRLARLAEVWEKVARTARDTADYNLERKPFVFSVFSQLAEATR